MKYVQINAYSGGWAPSVIFKRHKELLKQGHESYVFWARGDHFQDENQRKIATLFDVYKDAFLTRIDGKPGFHSAGTTKRLIRHLEKINPDVVHLHVLLGYYINIELLFHWLASHHCKVIWTHHDCWAFTGHCIYYTYTNCTQWKSGCCANGARCPQIKEYPESWFGSDVFLNYQKKRKLFTLLPPERLTLIAPSNWLAQQLEESYMGKYEIKVEPNEVDRAIFRRRASNFKTKYGIEKRITILGVASKWSERKGLNDFFRLSEELDDRFAIVVVGLSKQQLKKVKSIMHTIKCAKFIGLPKTSSIEELVEIYSSCDVLFNPTKEDNYPTVNLEAEACGLPVITYDTGGCRETIRSALSCVVEGYEQAKTEINNLAISNTEIP